MVELVRPIVVAIDTKSGFGLEFADTYEKSFGDLHGVYRDERAFVGLLKNDAGKTAYRVFSTADEAQTG